MSVVVRRYLLRHTPWWFVVVCCAMRRGGSSFPPVRVVSEPESKDWHRAITVPGLESIAHSIVVARLGMYRRSVGTYCAGTL